MKKNSSLDYLIISSAYPYRGGISDSTHSLANEMSNQNINCEVWTFRLLYPKLFFPGKTQYSKEVFKSDLIFDISANDLFGSPGLLGI